MNNKDKLFIAVGKLATGFVLGILIGKLIRYFL